MTTLTRASKRGTAQRYASVRLEERLVGLPSLVLHLNWGWDFGLRSVEYASHFVSGVWLRARLLSCKESRVFWWSRIFLSDSGSPTVLSSTSHSQVTDPHSCLLKWYNSFWNLFWNRFRAVHCDFHWSLVATKLWTAKVHSRYVKESEWEVLERLESDILPPTPQPWLRGH